MTKSISLPSGDFFVTSKTPCYTPPTPTLFIPVEKLGTFIVYWTAIEYVCDPCDYYGTAACNMKDSQKSTPPVWKYALGDCTETSFEELLSTFKEEKKWIIPILNCQPSGLCSVNSPNVDMSSIESLWIPTKDLQDSIIREIAPLVRVISWRTETGSWELVHRNSGKRVGAFEFSTEVQAVLYLVRNARQWCLRAYAQVKWEKWSEKVGDNLLFFDGVRQTEQDLTSDDWTAVREILSVLCSLDIMTYNCSCGFVSPCIDLVDLRGESHPVSQFAGYDQLHEEHTLYEVAIGDHNNNILKQYFITTIDFESLVRSHFCFVCPTCFKSSLVLECTRTSLTSFPYSMDFSQIATASSVNACRLPATTRSTISKAYCSECGHDITNTLRHAVEARNTESAYPILQPLDLPENWVDYLDKLYPAETF